MGIEGQLPAAVVVTGAYGTGKTSIIEEMADILEKAGRSYAAIDLDWLVWFEAPHMDQALSDRVFAANLAGVVSNYLSVGVERFLVAGAIESQADLDGLHVSVPMPLRVVRLTVPYEVIARRLGAAVTAGRADDLAVAATWLESATGEGIEDLTVANDRPIRRVAEEILQWLGWV
jgi:hypothetical protein